MATRILSCILALACGAGQAVAGEWRMMPFKDAEWSPDFTVALTYGVLDPDTNIADSDGALGLQVSLNCPWFSPPSGIIRQQFNLNRFDDHGLELTTFEINPRYYIGDGNLRFGFGPGFGYMWADPPLGGNEGLWTLQLGADIEYRTGALFLGLGTRYQFTENERVGFSRDSGMDNWLTTAKVGMNF